MSISRKNWSALSSLTRQWTMEDEEEVEREKRRRVRGSSSTADPEADFSQSPGDMPASGSTFEMGFTSAESQGLSSLEEVQVDFVEMLRVRDEKRRMRRVEVLRQQKEQEEGEEQSCRGGRRGGGGATVEPLGDPDEDHGGVFSTVNATSKPQPSPKTTSHTPPSSDSATHKEHGESACRDPEPEPRPNQTHKFFSSLSISLDKSPPASGRMTPTSPSSMMTPLSPQEHLHSPLKSPSPRGALSPLQNGIRQENASSSCGNFEQTAQPAFTKQSSRTVSFRMIRKKEEKSAPLQRSASVKMASKKFESSTDQNDDEEKSPSFQRNSGQRISSRSIQEMKERLAQAAQKSDIARYPDVAQRTLFLLDEVSRKRGLFEKEQQAANPTSPLGSRQGFRGFTSGMSDQLNRWVNKAKQPGSPHLNVDLRHVDISSKRSLFENVAEDQVPKTSAGKFK